ncbi:MAG: aspartate--tRNA ligase [Candidatus Niyogibacteria bacterium CG10_big_fil_rev_8_21_14_0_10_42_19]|uniref:Aspartate--tRNA(Asp/Asn) ligase n=1 Tax=Candidatus Niyogibacteria bacterium CG10_big_fil_rev_8_21_14_0_10_42_19 TaxID=1974725 RepID=A0A2H0TFU9_9BACT|nr:MAG: aspartate--tRNA ligase [Candidatus Niyogibacteria bacterium CG10_big_fil_rev_8_21_14_0_10_42_19]
MIRIKSIETAGKTGERVLLSGWVHSKRDHGKLIFVDLRDRWGIVQVVFSPQNNEVLQEAQRLRGEWVISVEGEIKKRPENMVNPNIINGEIELEAQKLVVLNESKTIPFAVDTDGYEIGDESRMKHRYIDLRRERMKKNLLLRDKITAFVRNFLHVEDFVEIETPILTKSTPEGARDYVVPSRLYPGNFYALPQSPQQYKQLLMVAGLERYFQIARCFRDEDTRGDRQPEFTQLDMEMSFVKREDVMRVNEQLLISLVQKIMPSKKIQEIPFPILSYKEAMEKFGSDRPDLRKDKKDKDLLAFCWVVDFPFFSAECGPASGGEKTKWTFTHNPFSSPKPEYREILMNKEKIGEILTSQYDVILNGFEIGGGSIRNHEPQALRKVFEIMGYSDERIDDNFSHMLEALSNGAPPHGGIAWGLDRLVAILAGEPNIREVIAFPKTGDARDLMMNAPSQIDEKQLKELYLSFTKMPRPSGRGV